MEEYESNEMESRNAEQPDQQPAPEVSHETRRSPFEDSPYEIPADRFEAPEEKKPKKNGGRRALSIVLAVLLVAGSCAATGFGVQHSMQKKMDQMQAVFEAKISEVQKNAGHNTDGISVSGTPAANAEGMTPAQVYAQNVDSVVAISNEGITVNLFGQVSETASSGSGFILTEDGYVVSNYHVVAGAKKLTVITNDETEYQAELVGYDEANDVSLLKIDAEGLKPVKIGSSDNLIIGDQVLAIGNPLGELTSTLTVGYVSGKDRTIGSDGSYINMMQTDAAINPGNSGGPLFNMNGEVVGITTAKYSGMTNSGASIEGIGFAIPIDDVMSMIPDLKERGYVASASLGVTVYSMDKQSSDRFGMPMGSLVETVVEGSCAQKAGVQPKDIIVGLGSYDVTGNTDLLIALRRYKPGEATTIEVYRGGKNVTLPITLDEKVRQEAPQPGNPGDEGKPMPEDGSFEEWYEYFAPYFEEDGKD